jgi:6-phosphogluconate dehydrogenase
MNDHGFALRCSIAPSQKLTSFGRTGEHAIGATLQEFLQTLKRPRKVMLMVKAGAPVDELIECLLSKILLMVEEPLP